MIIIIFHFCTYYIPIPYSYLMNKFIFSLATRSPQITQKMPLNEVVQEQSMLCEPLIPNAKTVKAMREARQRKTTKHKTIADLMADLHV